MWGMKRKEIRDCLGSKIPVRVWIPINQPTNQPTSLSLLNSLFLPSYSWTWGQRPHLTTGGRHPGLAECGSWGNLLYVQKFLKTCESKWQDQLLQGLPGLTHPRELCNLTAMSNTIYLPRCYTKMIDFTDAAAQPIWVVICTKMPLVQFKTEKNDQVVI